MQSTQLETALRNMVGFREDGDASESLNLPESLTTTTTGVTLDQLSEVLTLATLKRVMREGTTDFAAYLAQTRDAAIRATLNTLDLKLAEAGLSSQLLTPTPAFKTRDSNLLPQPKVPGRQVGIRIAPRLADVTLSIPRIQFAMSFIMPFNLVLTLREEGETDVLAVITLNQTDHYKWHTVSLPPLARDTAYWLTYEEDSLSHTLVPGVVDDFSFSYSAFNTLMGIVRPGNCQGCAANCPGSYATIQPMYIDSYYRAQVVSDTNFGLNLTVSAQTDLTARIEAIPLRLSAVYRLQLAITFLEKVAFSKRHNPDAEEAIQAALFELRGKDNAERLPPKLEKAWGTFIASMQKEVSPALSADTYGSIDFETT